MFDSQAVTQMKERLYRSRTDRKIAGVCGGIAMYFDVDPSLVRIAFVVLVFFNGFGLIAYLVCWLVLPEEPLELSSSAPAAEAETASFDVESTISNRSKRWATGIGVLLIAVGFAILIERLVPWLDVGDLLPYAFIVAGILLLYRGWRDNRRHRTDSFTIGQ